MGWITVFALLLFVWALLVIYFLTM